MKACKYHEKLNMNYCQGCDECRKRNKLYKVGFHYEEGGTVIVKAKSQKAAEKKVLDTLDYSGTISLDYERQHRDFCIC